MVSKRKFYKTVIRVTVLSEEDWTDWDSLSAVDYDITDGPCVGDIKTISHEEIDGKQAAKELMEARSDPEFFMLDENGDDNEDYRSVYEGDK